jgi:signal transduction histidine kinase
MTDSPRSWGIRLFERLPESTAVTVVGITVIVLVCWKLDAIPGPLSSGTLVMLPSSAAVLLVAAGALWLGRSSSVPRWSLFVSRLLGVLVTIAGAMFCYEAVLGRSLGIDLRPLLDPLRQRTWPAEVPAPNAAVAFLLLGMALATLDVGTRRRGHRPALWCATFALLIGFTALVGYVDGAASLFTFEPQSGMALLTALCLVALSLGIVFARRAAGLSAILVDDAAGGVLARRLLPAAVLVPIALGWLWLWGQRLGPWNRADGPSLFVVMSSVALVWLVARSARVVHATDVQRARLLVREQDARREAETANRTKGDFLAVMSHELRTPLSAIIGYQELLADGITGPVTEPQRQQLARIKVSARHLLQLIDEILTYSRAEAGKEEVRYELVPVNAMLDDAAAFIEPLAGDKGVTFVVTRLDGPLTMWTDPRKVRQILVNLLSNAVKFTDAGGMVRLSVTRTDNQLELSISDTGIGIGPDYLERVFDPFWQVEQKATRRAGGTGLGLSVSRRLARLLGGDISVASELGRGSVFSVRLPTASAHDRPPRQPTPSDRADIARTVSPEPRRQATEVAGR